MRRLNICLHNIVKRNNMLQSPYDLTIEQLHKVVELAERGLQLSHYEDYNLYFDDSYRSFVDTVTRLDFLQHIPRSAIKVAVIPERLGTENYMTSEDVIEVHDQGYEIASHGYSHAALAVFENDMLLSSPEDGKYQNAPYGQGKPLSHNEITYQFEESKLFLEKLTGRTINEFVLPYGLYNSDVLSIAKMSGYYSKILSCHSAIDTGTFLAPRHLVSQYNIATISNDVLSMGDQFSLLPN